MILSGVNVINTSQVNAAETVETILEKVGDTYTLENYVTSLKEAQEIQKRYFENDYCYYVSNLLFDIFDRMQFEISIK